MAIKPYLQLVRLPNLFTAAADSLAGWLLVEGGFHSPERWVCLVGASVATYAGGIVLNDLLDLEVDRKERPNRPLPSGRVPLGVARSLAIGFLGLGIGLAIASRTPNAWLVELALIACVVGYDAGLKRSWLGPEAMGMCRALNLLLGMSAARDFGGPRFWLFPVFYGTFVAGITWISRAEVGGESRRNVNVLIGSALQLVSLSGYLLAPLILHSGFALPDRDVGYVSGYTGFFLMVCLTFLIGYRTFVARRTLDPSMVQKAVKTGIFSLVWLHVVMLAYYSGTLAALTVGCLWIPAMLTGRWIYST
jgi:4-hydroxybenzoate polyprenyltransferase